ncbi:hypothetical protein AALP_AA5G021600 [Arabis alpina]|uniref:Uncharacterized protein n=1 Tax=Arabis alpina TaxID=50452 RepID=A0A087GUF3_ARAAL|nr:hypothetical protein AALP_AA5G021600 [Arabis alpina]
MEGSFGMYLRENGFVLERQKISPSHRSLVSGDEISPIVPFGQQKMITIACGISITNKKSRLSVVFLRLSRRE